MRFTKMQGAGNDYIYVDCFRAKPPLDPAAVSRQVSDRHFGVGGDGLILICSSDNGADARMRMFNVDGSEAEMCGNGLRCGLAETERVVDLRTAAPAAERPDGAPPDRVGADVLFDIGGVEAGEIVPFSIVFAHVREAEPAILIESIARERRAVVAVQATARRFAHPFETGHAVGRQRFGSPSGHPANMCSGETGGKRGKRWVP